jgi:hypothetical protein
MSLKDELRKIEVAVGAGLPPCTACTNDVSSHDAVQVFGLPYHRNCLACSRCKVRLDKDIAEHKSRPVCINCSAFFQGKRCDRCGEGAAHAVNAMGKRFCKGPFFSLSVRFCHSFFPCRMLYVRRLQPAGGGRVCGGERAAVS